LRSTVLENTDLTIPLPEFNELNQPYWDSLKQGHLSFQHCTCCSHNWLPPRSECPHCLEDKWTWQAASGRAKLISWVVYHMAYHPAFAQRLPYAVAVVALEEGARLISNVIGVDDFESLKIDQALQLVIEVEQGLAIPRFKPV
jgi:uncharacterized OB-fold protein